MGCNCGGRSGGRATGTGGRSGGGATWRHTDQYGGVVPYQDEGIARAGLRRSRGIVEQVEWGTGAVLKTIRYEDLENETAPEGRQGK